MRRLDLANVNRRYIRFNPFSKGDRDHPPWCIAHLQEAIYGLSKFFVAALYFDCIMEVTSSYIFIYILRYKTCLSPKKIKKIKLTLNNQVTNYM